MNTLEKSTDLTRPATDRKMTAQQPQTFLRISPPVDVYENEDELLLVADVPGAKQETIDVRLEPPRLTIEAEQARASQEQPGVPSIRFERTFRVPDGLDPEKVEAKLERGVLSIHLRKSERIKPRRIAVKSG